MVSEHSRSTKDELESNPYLLELTNGQLVNNETYPWITTPYKKKQAIMAISSQSNRLRQRQPQTTTLNPYLETKPKTTPNKQIWRTNPEMNESKSRSP